MKLLLSILVLFALADAKAQLPLWYQCLKTETAPVIDGDLSDLTWQAAPWSELFGDIRNNSFLQPEFDTRFKMLWDEDYLYVGVWLQEPHIRGRLRQRDTVIFYDNDIELFIDPDNDHHNYGELEVNALNTHWDLILPKPYSNGGKADNGWDIDGLQKAVGLYGTINDPTDIDSGWVTEWAIPMEDIGALCSDGRSLGVGDHMKVNFSRVQWPLKVDGDKGVYVHEIEKRGELNWTWTPQGAVAMHKPEMWGVVILKRSLQELNEMPPLIEEQERYRQGLMGAYHLVRKYQKEHGAVLTMAELGDDIYMPSPNVMASIVQEGDGGWVITYFVPGRLVASIRGDRLFTFERLQD